MLSDLQRQCIFGQISIDLTELVLIPSLHTFAPLAFHSRRVVLLSRTNASSSGRHWASNLIQTDDRTLCYHNISGAIASH